MDQVQEELGYGYRNKDADQLKGSVPWYALPILYFVRPSKFMLSWGIHANIGWVLVIAWLLGSSAMTNTVINRSRFIPDSLPIDMNSWSTVWFVVLGFGVLRGLITAYGVGGLWTWGRLRICGIKGNEWNRSTRLFQFSMIATDFPPLIALGYFSIRYDTLRDFLAQPVGLVHLIAALFMLWSPIFGYFGVRACYRLKGVFSIILFLIIPMSWRLVVLMVVLFSSGTPLLPDTQHPLRFADQHVEFDYPGDWVANSLTEDGDGPYEFELHSKSDRESMLIRVQAREDADLIQYDLDKLKSDGFIFEESTPAPNIRIEDKVGDGVDYIVSKDSKRFKMLHLKVHFDVDHDVLIRMIASDQNWRSAMVGWMQVIKSFSIGDLYQIVPDIDNPVSIDRVLFTHEAPGNWHVSELDQSPFTYFEISAQQYSSFSVTIIDRDVSIQEELDMFLNHSIDDVLVSHANMSSWIGLNGIGVQGRVREPLVGYRGFKELYVPLPDGRVLNVGMYQAESSNDLTDPGFDLIESTFKLKVELTDLIQDVDP